jgi:hypothetical protein
MSKSLKQILHENLLKEEESYNIDKVQALVQYLIEKYPSNEIGLAEISFKPPEPDGPNAGIYSWKYGGGWGEKKSYYIVDDTELKYLRRYYFQIGLKLSDYNIIKIDDYYIVD